MRSAEAGNKSAGLAARVGDLWEGCRRELRLWDSQSSAPGGDQATIWARRGCSGPRLQEAAGSPGPLPVPVAPLAVSHGLSCAGTWCFTELVVLGEWPRAQMEVLGDRAGHCPWMGSGFNRQCEVQQLALVGNRRQNVSPKLGLIHKGILFGSQGNHEGNEGF